MASALVKMRSMNSTEPLTTAITTAEGEGLTLRSGTDITGPQIGVVYYDRQDEGGLVLRIADAEHLPETGAECAVLLTEHGYTLTEQSVREIDALGA